MDPKKLKAFAKGGGGDEEGGGGGGGEEHDDEREEGEGEGGEESEGRFKELIPLLEENAEDIEEMADEVDPDSLTNPEAELTPEDEQSLTDQVDQLDEGLANKMKEVLSGGLSHDDAMKLADHLAEEEMIEDAGIVGGWLFRMAAVIQKGGGEGEEEEETEGEEETEEGGGEGEEEGEGAEAE